MTANKSNRTGHGTCPVADHVRGTERSRALTIKLTALVISLCLPLSACGSSDTDGTAGPTDSAVGSLRQRSPILIDPQVQGGLTVSSAIDSAAHRLYVTVGYTVAVIDTSTDALVDSVEKSRADAEFSSVTANSHSHVATMVDNDGQRFFVKGGDPGVTLQGPFKIVGPTGYPVTAAGPLTVDSERSTLHMVAGDGPSAVIVSQAASGDRRVSPTFGDASIETARALTVDEKTGNVFIRADGNAFRYQPMSGTIQKLDVPDKVVAILTDESPPTVYSQASLDEVWASPTDGGKDAGHSIKMPNSSMAADPSAREVYGLKLTRDDALVIGAHAFGSTQAIVRDLGKSDIHLLTDVVVDSGNHKLYAVGLDANMHRAAIVPITP